MNIKQVTLKDIEQIRKETLDNFEKNNSDLLNELSAKIEDAVKEGINSIDTGTMFCNKSSPEGLQNYLISKGFETQSSCSGNLIKIYW